MPQQLFKPTSRSAQRPAPLQRIDGHGEAHSDGQPNAHPDRMASHQAPCFVDCHGSCSSEGSGLELQLRQLGRAHEQLRLDNEQLARALAESDARCCEAQRLAHHDGLTGLPNRMLLLQRLQDGIAECFARQRRMALMFIDLDGFKVVNDHFGHATGDKLLTVVATRLAASVRSDDVACRYGGDEFVVMLNNIGESAAAVSVAEQIRSRIDGRYWIEGQEIQISASIGLALYPADGEQWDALLSCADASMYRNKRERRERWQRESLAAVDAQLHPQGDGAGLSYVRYQTDADGVPT